MCIQCTASAKTISIHALREEGDAEVQLRLADRNISIHALREEGDGFFACLDCIFFISIHALREEGDARLKASWVWQRLFLSTPSVRRATRRLWRRM